MIKNDDGMIAVQHFTSNGFNVQIGDAVYIWTPKYNISMAWVQEVHLSQILNIRTKHCCGKKRNRFFLASQTNVCLWMTGKR